MLFLGMSVESKAWGSLGLDQFPSIKKRF